MAIIPVEVVAVAFPISQQLLERDEHCLHGSFIAWIHSREVLFHNQSVDCRLCINPAFVFVDYSALRTQNCTLAGTAAVQCTGSPAELSPWSRLKENPH